MPDSDITASAESARTYAGSPGSVKLIGGSDGVNGSTFTQTITLPDTNPYTLSANVYTTGAAVTAADAELFAGTNTVPVTSFTALSGGWYRMTASITGITSSQSYGVYVHAGKTVYVDNFGLAEANASASTLAVQNAQTGLGQLFVESTTNLNTGLSSLQGLIVKGAFSQTANLQEWQNSAGVVFTSVLANGLVNATTGGLATFYKAGTGITNADFADTVPNGTLAVDAADNALYIRSGGAWKYITFTGGFQIPKEEAAGMTPGDYLLPYAESTMENGNLHGLYAKFSDVKGLLFASESAVLASLSATLHQDFAWQASISAQVNSVIFHKNINVLGVVTFNSDRAGEAIISKDSSAVDVHFAHPYAQPPVVTFSLVVPESSGSATFIDEGHQAYLAGVTSEGFTIVLPNLAIHDYLYQWTAFSVSDMTTTVSKP